MHRLLEEYNDNVEYDLKVKECLNKLEEIKEEVLVSILIMKC